MGRSRGELTRKIVARVEALGNLVFFLLLPGQNPREQRDGTPRISYPT